MTRYSFFALCMLLGLLSATAAVPGTLQGIVHDAETDEPVSGVIVKTKTAFTSTGSDGRFTLKLTANVDSVTFRLLGYETLTLPVTAEMSSVRLEPKVTQLKDIIVKAPDIYARGDTLVFNVERYANAGDNAIIDVIKRLPGIKVEDDGTIKYQGKPISKFYIDGNDFLDGRYGLATENLSHKDVKSVEVMEKHQPVKALEGIEFPEEAGINLTLKDDARSTWVGVAKASAGVQPFLYDGSLFGMRIGRGAQNLFTLKADNTGWNPANEIREHSFEDMFNADYNPSPWPEYISADIISAPLAEKRTRDNLSWLANAITAWKSGDTSMRLNLNYAADRLDYTTGTVTDYFSTQIPQFVQNNSLRTQTHDISARFNAEINRSGYYLKDKVTVSAVLDKSSSAITGSFNLGQRVNRKSLSVGNDLKLVKRSHKRIFTLTSRNTFAHRPDQLLVTTGEDVCQNINTTAFRSTTETRLGHLTRFWKYYLTAGLDIDWHRLNTTLTGMEMFDNSGVHNAFTSKVYGTPQVEYNRNRWRVTMSLPVKWFHYSVAGQHDFLDVTPRVHVNRQLTSKSELVATASYHLGAPQAFMYLDNPVLADYRNLFVAAFPGKYSQSVSSSLTYRYRNPLKALFINSSAVYTHHRNGVMSDQQFIGDFIISTYTDVISQSDVWTISAGISKGLGHSRMVIGCDVSGTSSSASSMRDGTVVPYRQLSASAKPFFKGSLARWLSVNYEATGSLSRLKVGTEPANSTSLHQSLFATIMPTDRWQFTVGAEHYLSRFPKAPEHFPVTTPSNNASVSNTANLILLDATAVWHVSNRLRLSLTANNLLDSRHYRYNTYGTLSTTRHTFTLRPRTILATLQLRL